MKDITMMNYRKIGKTEIKASIIGLGSEHVDTEPRQTVEEVVHAAIDHGINIMDIFMPGEEVRTNIGYALSGRRDKMIIQGAIGSVDLNLQYDISRDLKICQQYFENLLKYLKTDYIDIGMLFFLDSHEAIDEMINNGVVEYAQQLKKAGKIRHIGASLHNPETALRLVKEDLVEMIMFSINPAFDIMPDNVTDVMEMFDEKLSEQNIQIDPKRAELYSLCQSRGVGITVMKSLGSGRLVSAEQSPFTKSLTVGQCIHYALNRPAVASVLVGCDSREQVETAVKYLSLSAEEKDYSQIINNFKDGTKAGFKGSCVYCNHCLPCPSEINIAQVHKYLDIARLDENNIPTDIINEYQSLKTHASDCVECASCEERCPFSVEIIENMKKTAKVFKK